MYERAALPATADVLSSHEMIESARACRDAPYGTVLPFRRVFAAGDLRQVVEAGDAGPGRAPWFAGVCESVQVVRFLLAAAAAGGANARQLAGQARVPAWALADEAAMISSRHALRLWELAEQALHDPDVALGVAARYQLGELGLYDYLFRTAATLGEGLEASRRYLPLVTTNGRLRVESRSGQETTYSYSYLEADGRGQELAMQFSIALLLARARSGTGRPVAPVHVGFTQPAPRSYRAFIETFGTRQIDFGATATTFTLRASDLDLPMRDADPVLASLLRRCAASLPPPAIATWLDHFRQQLSEAIEQGSPSLAALGRRMSISTRTLQRRLAEHGTTWRAELEAARQHYARRARQAGSPSMTRLARELGYADPRSARRAMRRWDNPARRATVQSSR
jgi:AraC-like DNA-binding protein